MIQTALIAVAFSSAWLAYVGARTKSGTLETLEDLRRSALGALAYVAGLSFLISSSLVLLFMTFT